MVKRIFSFLAALILLAGATVSVFWFNSSSASKKTVTRDPLPDSYVDDSHLQGSTTVPGTDIGQDVLPPDGSDPDGSDPGSEGSDTTQPEEDSYTLFLESLSNVLDAQSSGYRAAYTFGEGAVLVYESKLSDYTDRLLPTRTECGRIYFRFSPSLGSAAPSIGSQYLPMLSLYGGLLLENNGGKQSVLSWLGEYACSADGYFAVYAKDAQNRSLFWKDGSYYYYDEEQCAFVQTDAPTDRGLYFDYTPDYAVSDHPTPFLDAETGLWGYRNAAGETVIKAQFYRAFAFSENGIAAVQKNKLDGLLFINTAGKTVLDSHLRYYTYNGNLAFDWMRAPTEMWESSLGCLYFDHGYMRVTVQTYALSNSTEVLFTKEALVDAEGNYLDIPPDYTLVSYSDGVAVLCKDGRYGYYSHEGRWLTDPVYTEAAPFSGGLGVAKDANGRYHAFDTCCREVIPAVFDYVSAPSMGKILCYKEGQGWTLLSIYEKEAPTEEDGGAEDTKEDEITQ